MLRQQPTEPWDIAETPACAILQYIQERGSDSGQQRQFQGDVSQSTSTIDDGGRGACSVRQRGAEDAIVGAARL